MKISHSYKLFASAIILLLILMGLIVLKALRIQEEVILSEQKRFRSLLIATELFQSSEDMTRMARSYVSTGNQIYEKRYFDILDIRNGKLPRPQNYAVTYWHLAGVGKGSAMAPGETVELEELMRREGFTEEEFALLRESQNNSDHLVNMEKKAFAAMKGLYDDGRGNFTVLRAPSRNYAISLLFSKEYDDEKAAIMAPLQKFMDVLEKRTKADLNFRTSELRQYILLAMVFVILTVIIVFFMVFHAFQKILYPLERLRKQIAKIASGNYAARCDIDSANEIGELSTYFNNMAGFLENDIKKREQAQQSLRESEEKYRNILENILEGYFETDLKGNIVFANDSACNLLGYDKEALYKINYRQFSTPTTKKKFQEIYGEVLHTGIPSKISDYEIIRSDGAIRVNELSVALLRDHNGKPAGFRAVARDITEEKQTEKLIRIRLSLFEFAATHSLEELLQKTLDEVGPLVNSPIGFYHFVEEDQKTLSLQAWSTRTLNEFCKAEGKGMHYGIDQAGVWVDCVHTREAVVHNDYNSLPHRKGLPQGHAAVIRELVVPIIRGKNIVAILGVGNKPTEYTQKDIEIVSYLADVAWEIAEHKQAEEAIETSRKAMSILMENIDAGIMVVDPFSRAIEKINSHAAKLIGAPIQQITGKICHRFICPADIDCCPIIDLGQEVENSERIVLRSDGSKLAVLKTVKK